MKLGEFLFVDQFHVLPPKSTLLQRIRHLRRHNWSTVVNVLSVTVAVLGLTFGLTLGYGLARGLVDLIFTK